MTNKTKMWIVRLIFLSIFIYLVSLIRIETDTDNDGFISVNTDSLKFDSKEWNRHENDYEVIRPYMLDDLMRNVLLPGLDSLKIKSLIGLPYWNKEGKFYYKIGILGGMEPTYLVIEFDENGKLKHKYQTDI